MTTEATDRHALIFHGTGGTSDGNWFPWLKQELERDGYRVAVPQFPTPEGQSLESWLEALDGYSDYIQPSSVLIGHSLGGLFTLRVLERFGPVYGAVFVSAPIGVRPIRFYDSDHAFSGFDFDWARITANANHRAVFHSNDDPYVSLANGEELAQHLGVDLTFIPDAGHLNAESGYTKLSPVLDAIHRFDALRPHEEQLK